jgi:hypothetical protein
LEDPIVNKQSRFLVWMQGAQCQQHIEAMFLYGSAPVIRGVKAGALIRIPVHCLEAWNERQRALRKATGLHTLEISNRNGALLLIYDQEAMRTVLDDPRAKVLLTSYGYPVTDDPEMALARLQERFAMVNCPHEVGIFLGYPPEDVQAFIDNAGKNCLCCRYWKVYHNAQQAQETFRKIDAAASDAIDLLSKSMPIHVVTKLLKAV